MFINKYTLIFIGGLLAVMLTIFINIFVGFIFCLLFWFWYFSKKEYTLDEIDHIQGSEECECDLCENPDNYRGI